MTSKVLNINNYLFNVFGEKVWKLPINAGYMCPNRDEHGLGGCIYCDARGSKAPWVKNWMSVDEQFIKGRGIAKKYYSAKKFIVYFQAYTSTNATSSDLERLYDKVLSYPDVVGLAISTRPDCISNELIEIFNKLNNRTFLWIELGAQSMFDSSLTWMNRGHDVKCFQDTCKKLVDAGISVVGHLIFGLPLETKAMMLESFKRMLACGIKGYKIHPLHIVKNTKLHKMYEKESFKLLELNEYVELIKEVFSFTPFDCVVHRVGADLPNKDLLIAPNWVLEKNLINELLSDFFLS